jgi:23S rRNA (uracil1939-C5)-methyltransferase
VSARLTISRLGAQGDGVADTERGPVFVPFALPGEDVIAAVERDRGVLLSVAKPSLLRVEPPCRHFGTCGGCAIQHLEPGSYHAWKRELVVGALARSGIETPVGELVACQPQTRRRAVFSARRTDAGMLLGYNGQLSGEIVAIQECPILLPEIVAALDGIRQLATLIASTPRAFRIAATSTASGLDLAASECGPLSEKARRLATHFVISQGFARLTVDGEIVVEPKQPIVMFDGVAVAVPPGGFLQATEAAESAMAALVGAHLGRARKIADLFSGSGTFALRLARRAEVHAFEGDAAALAAVDRAFRHAAGLKRVTAERRDLFRRPLSFKELAVFDGLVFDPPRAGAEDQARQIARSDIAHVAAVSCNPATLARDLRILVDGGYSVKSVTPIDQFLWSHHVEAVALLEKPRRRR